MDSKCQECVQLSLIIRCLNKEIEESRQKVVELEKENKKLYHRISTLKKYACDVCTRFRYDEWNIKDRKEVCAKCIVGKMNRNV